MPPTTGATVTVIGNCAAIAGTAQDSARRKKRRNLLHILPDALTFCSNPDIIGVTERHRAIRRTDGS
jgi:hypothetical protein